MPHRWADIDRFAPIPKEVADQTNHLQAMILSWIIYGRAYTPREITINNTVVSLERGDTWGSLVSIGQDIRFATGKGFTRRQLTYARDGLVEKNLLIDKGGVANGAFGKIYHATVLPTPEVDPIMDFRVFYYGDAKDFRYTEIVSGRFDDYSTRGNKGVGEAWERQWAKQGLDKPSFVRTGRWRAKEVGDANAPVYMPWLIFDLDRQNLLDAFEEARRVLANIEEQFSLHDVFVAFSGRRGVHILFPTGKIGNPVFANSDSARYAINYMVERLAEDVQVDPAPTSPLTLIRVIGSTHEKTGHKKRAWTAHEFMETAPTALLDNLKEHRPIIIPDPRLVAPEGDTALIDAAAIYAEDEMRREFRSRRKTNSGGKGIIARIEKGVAESEQFSPGHQGRSKATFLYARYLTNNLRLPYEEALARMLLVNQRHKPPMKERRVEYILNWTIKNEVKE